MANKLYTEDSIQSLSPLEFTRLRPGVYCGSTEYSTQLLIEIVSNSIDEFKAGHGNTIDVIIDTKKNEYIVTDHAQGFPYNVKREDGKTVLQAAFDTLNTSGKFSDNGVYEGTALGLNGIGSKLTNYLSHWLQVASCSNGKDVEQITFKEGVFEKRELFKLGSEEAKFSAPMGTTGTTVWWHPSEKFFTHPEVDLNKVKELFHVLSCLCIGLTINLYVDGKKEEFVSKNGLNDLVDNETDSEIVSNRLQINFDGGKNKLDLVLTYDSSYSSQIVAYVNTGETDGGPHITQIKTIVTREFNKFFKGKKWLKDKDENLSGDEIQEGMILVFNLTAPGVSYDAQTKSRIVKIDMAPFSNVITESLDNWFENNEKDIKTIFDKAIAARKAKEAAKKARDKVREFNKKPKKQFLDLPTKLVDCWSKKRLDCEIYVVEGDSAASGLVDGRDSEFIAVFPVRGKMLNCLKATDDKIFANAEINNLIKALGLKMDEKTKKLIYNKNDLRYGKIVAAADADPDGKAIKNLLFTDLWYLCPELITNGHVYAAVPPLFRITTSKNEYIFLKGQEELDEYNKKHRGEKYLINRNKGLGEQDSQELEESILNKETRNIVQITVEDIKKAQHLFDTLMGTAVPPRREYLLAHSEEAEDING